LLAALRFVRKAVVALPVVLGQISIEAGETGSPVVKQHPPDSRLNPARRIDRRRKVVSAQPVRHGVRDAHLVSGERIDEERRLSPGPFLGLIAGGTSPRAAERFHAASTLRPRAGEIMLDHPAVDLRHDPRGASLDGQVMKQPRMSATETAALDEPRGRLGHGIALADEDRHVVALALRQRTAKRATGFPERLDDVLCEEVDHAMPATV
jgi:hypothetical protein